MEKKQYKWYALPPYKNEGWKILNEKGELVATFEDKTECENVVDLYNSQQCYEMADAMLKERLKN